jgi:hypothetical protein
MMQKSSIWITSIDPPINGGTLWVGTAESTDGARYKFGTSEYGGAYCFREDESGIWWQEKASAALVSAAQAAMRAAILAAAH